MLKTALCSALGIEYPILSVGMGALAGPELTAAVSNAGACGVLGRVSGAPAADVRQRIDHVRTLTDKPFGVNVILATLQARGGVHRSMPRGARPSPRPLLGRRAILRAGGASPGHQRCSSRSHTAESTVYTSLFDGGSANAPYRVLRDKAVAEWEAAGRPPSGRRPGEGSIIGTVPRGGSTVELPRYSARSYPLRGFKGDIEYCVPYAGNRAADPGPEARRRHRRRPDARSPRGS
jgi:NAD(P)H-dependent flavin oxidoreductase YrpB (nitropropane dioxygenase family)